jgi:hypothetical protein
MDQVTTSPAEDAELSRFGYRQQFTRSLRQFESFATGKGAYSSSAPVAFIVGSVLGIGLVFYIAALVTEPAAMRAAPEAEAE